MLYVVVEPNSEVMFSLPGFDADGDKVCGVWGIEVQPVVDFVTTLALLSLLVSHGCTPAPHSLALFQ